MPNQIDNTGLQIKTNTVIIAELTAALQAIYGADINLNSSSPDGQNVNIFAQAVTDLLELIVAVYNSFDIESANGVLLDQRVALNGISRAQGTYTFKPISITVDRALTLTGLDASLNDPAGTGFTVADDAGVQWILAATHAFGAAGTASLSFRAALIGEVDSALNTITNQVTVTTGVTTVNNPLESTVIGVNEESDARLKIRRIQSFMLQATSNADAVEAAILALSGVTDAIVVEDDTAHTLWCIVEGGTAAAIAAAIYAKRSAGSGLVGNDESVVITRVNGLTKTIVFDRPEPVNIYIKLTLTPKAGSTSFDADLIKSELTLALTYKLNERATIGDIITAMNTIEPDAIVSAAGISLTTSGYTDILAPATPQNKFVVGAARIAITQ